MFYISHNWPDMLGFMGVFLTLLAYVLLQLHRINKDKYLYSVLNLVGAALILVSLLFNWNWSAVMIEIAWILISAYGVLRVSRQRFG